MTWKPSRFRAGDLVEVRSKEEILATLDGQGRLDGMPFMPEMLRFCGRRFRVSAVAHKSCDTSHHPGTARRLDSTVHLDGLRCDGSAHAGCQAECNLFWKDAWLKRAGRDESGPARPGGCTEEQLLAATRQPPGAAGEGPRFACQATRLVEASRPLPWWDPRQYFFDVRTRNWRAGRVLRVLGLAWLRQLQPRVPFGYRLMKALHDRLHRRLVGRASPEVRGKLGRGALTPTGRLDLQPGEWVRIKSQRQIEETLNQHNKNRGLFFDAEMASYCGRVVRVRQRVSTILDEATGKVLHMKEPCIALEGVVCGSEFSACRLMCPRAIVSYWREIWLERVESPAGRAEAGAGSQAEGPCDGDAPSGGRRGPRVGLPLLRSEGRAGAVEGPGVAV